MPAKSKQQQKFFGVVKAMQKGDIPKKGEAGKVAKDMSKKEVDKYAGTKHKGLPKKVKKETMKLSDIKKMVREELQSLNEVDQKVFDIYAILGKALTKANMVPKAYRADYGQSLINMSMRDEKDFIDTYGDSTIEDFIEDMEYNLQNENKVNEDNKDGIRFDLVMSDEAYDELFDLISKYVEDPDDVEKELDRYDDAGFDGMSNMVTANLDRDKDYIAWKKKYGIKEGKITEAKMTPAKVQKAQRELVATIQLLKKNFPMYKKAKESGDDKKLAKHRDIAVKLTKKKKQLELALDRALGGLYQDAELELKEAKRIKPHDLGYRMNLRRARTEFNRGENIAAVSKSGKGTFKIDNVGDFPKYPPRDWDYAFIVKEAAPRMRKDPDVEQLMSILKDVSRIETKMRTRDRSRHSHFKKEFNKFFDALINLKNKLQIKGPTIPEGKLTEGRGVMNLIKDAVKELMFDGNISEKEAAMELVTAISDEYQFDAKLKEGKLNEALPKFKSPAEGLKWVWSKRDEAMDMEQELKDISSEIQQLLGDMEQEAEPGGGPKADRYGKELEALENKHKDLRAEYDMVMAEIDEFDQYYIGF
jgi:hypothetical protein